MQNTDYQAEQIRGRSPPPTVIQQGLDDWVIGLWSLEQSLEGLPLTQINISFTFQKGDFK
jgi:hypothetical protein